VDVCPVLSCLSMSQLKSPAMMVGCVGNYDSVKEVFWCPLIFSTGRCIEVDYCGAVKRKRHSASRSVSFNVC
jgi:hypothetical protein